MIVYVGKAVTENDVCVNNVDRGAIVESVEATLAQSKEDIKSVQKKVRNGIIVRLLSETVSI